MGWGGGGERKEERRGGSNEGLAGEEGGELVGEGTLLKDFICFVADKMAVFLCMEEYIRLAEDSRAVGFSLHSVNHRYKQNR